MVGNSNGMRTTLTNKMEEKERKTCNIQRYFHKPVNLIHFKLILTFVCFPSACFGENLQAPRFSMSSSLSSTVRLGTTKIIQCQAFGYPQPQYKWLKESKSITELSSEVFYRIISAQHEDEGSYRCIASNKVGSIISEEIKITIAYMGIFEDKNEKFLTVEEGQAAVLNLPTIESSPEPDVTWQTDDGPIPYAQKYAKSASNQLVILSIDDTDQKAYRARAINTQEGKEENSPFIRLSIISSDSYTEIAPEIIIPPQNLHIVKGTAQATLDCIANARPLHELETLWFKDDLLIENSGISYTSNDLWNRSLTLVSANLSHSGVYNCEVKLRTGGFPVAKAGANVLVLEKPTFVSSARTEALGDYGSEINLLCDAIGVPKPNIKWFKNAKEIDLSEKRYVVEEDNSLLIKRLQIEDSGMFQCFAYNEAGESSISTWLKVKTSVPIMEMAPQNITVLDGKDATLTCRAVGAPIPTTSWTYKDQSEIAPSGRIQILESGDLLISPVKDSDAGLYSCKKANDAGAVKGSAYLTVLVRTQIVHPPVDTKVLLGHTVTMQCKVSSDPGVPYQLDWFHNKQIIQFGLSQRILVHSDGTLEIQAVRAADVGQYTCSVKSPGGNETRSAKLSVIELPFAPINVKAARLDAHVQRAVNVSWTSGFDGNSAILKFIVQKREIPELGPIPDPLMNWVTELSNISAEQRWVLLTNLKAAAAYQFRVSALNSVGEGSPSEPSNQVMLPQEAPSGPPVGFVGSARSSSEIITQWQPPLDEHRNGLILGYIIRYRLFGYSESPWTTRNITNEAQRNYLITDLITWKDYIVQIAAYNNKGVGVFTDGSKIKTREGVPEAPPIIEKVEAVNSTAVQVWWIPPDPQKINGINQGYKLQSWKYDLVNKQNIETKMITVHPNLLDPFAKQTAIIGDLEKYSKYNVTVLCFTNPGDGEISESVQVQTTEDVPGEICNLRFNNISDRSVIVLWSPPKHTNGILTGYQVAYQIKDKNETLTVEQLDANVTRIEISHLYATTHYRFEVSAKTAKGIGLTKVAVIQSGIEPVLPHPPSKLALSNIQAFSVVLQYIPGFDGNSSITKWIVQAQTARNMTWFTIYDVYDPDATTITVKNLVPFTLYKLRVIANNVVGSSEPSEPSQEFQTIQAAPAYSPKNVTVRAMSATELRVRWIPLQQIEWFGNPRGYNITYVEMRNNKVRSEAIDDPTANSHIISGLEEYALYQIMMQAYNEAGSSTLSPIALERTRESVPSFGPINVEANATSSTTIVVNWGEVPKEHQNGLIEGYKVCYRIGLNIARMLPNCKVITNNSTYTTTLTELRKFITYHIQVLAYTRLGDGIPSTPPLSVQTFEDTPGEPSNVSFPDVSFTSARIIWDIPEESNGEILAYKVTYQINSSQSNSNKFSKEFAPSDRTFRATQLEPEKYYLFTVTAQTRLGWGKTALVFVLTTNNREIPQPPSLPQISRSQIQSKQITFSWTPGRDGFAPLRYYTVQKMEHPGPWQTVPERVDPLVISYTVLNLKPFTSYKFRIQATNDIGPSRFSPESIDVRTLPAAPSRSVSGLKVIPITPTSVEVYWIPVDEQYWCGDTSSGGYRVVFQPLTDFPATLQATPKEEVIGINSSKIVLHDLLQDRNYEIIVVAFNSQGEGPATPPSTVYVGEAVPTGEPRDLEGEAISSTEVHLMWKPPQQHMQNGELLGYKIFYLVTKSPQVLEAAKKIEEEIEVVLAACTTHSLVFLDKYTEYKIQILAFNPAGDGPRSQPIMITTLQGLPTAPLNLRFTDITMNSLKVIWDAPKKSNGNIEGYSVIYETIEQNERFSNQVKLKVTTTSLQVHSLEEEVMYTFTVRAQTIGYGPLISNNVTTGPQEGSPGKPRELTLVKTMSSVELHWLNGPSGKGPLLGYYIETRKKDDIHWQITAQTTNGPLQDFTVSYQNLQPSTLYSFRLIPYNTFGVSYPGYSNDYVLTPSKLYLEYGFLQQKPFYRQTWFMVALAATSVIIIIMIIAVLCVKSKSYKYKQEAQKTLEESLAMDPDERHEVAMELYRSRQCGNGNAVGTINKRNTLRKTAHHLPPQAVLGKSPPRPSPASVAYHSDEESLKGYDENPDDSSVTEKPSEISSSDSQASESENESVRSDPPSFVNHYANINDSLRQSWKRQKPVRNYSSYTDSEPEGSAVVSLNGGQIIMNNMARSRAPLPGFSSFV